MGSLIAVLLAEGFAVKAVAFLALCLVGYLYWTGIREKLERRRERRWLEERRRETSGKAVPKSKPPARA